MPYIDQKRRLELRNNDTVETPGELNYMISKICQEYLMSHNLKYQTINDIVGALEGAKLEFYRRMAAPYENDKIEQNGDVY